MGEETNLNKSNKVQILPTEKYFSLIRQTLSETGHAYVRVTGMSMWPLLHHLRDGVVIIPPEKVRVGDIVLFDRRDRRYALHRVIWKRRHGFVMAGDHQWHFEKDLPYDQILGTVVSIDRNGRRLSCKNVFIKGYALTVTALTFPRIYLWKLVRILCRPFRNRQPSGQKGTT